MKQQKSGNCGPGGKHVLPAPPRRREVTFRTSPHQGGERVAVVGEFNDWSISSHPMVRTDDHFELVVSLAPGRYRFRYLVDGSRWENDWRADAYEPNAFGGEDSVVEVPAQDDPPDQPSSA